MAKALQSPGSFLTIMLEKYNLNPFKLSKDIHLSQSAVRLITIGKTKITVSVAMRLAKYFNTNPEFWLAMQMKWDIAEALQDKALVKVLKTISRVSKGAAGGAKKPAAAKKPVAAKKPAAKKKTAKKAAAKKPAAKKPAARKTAAKRPAAKKRAVTARKPVARKSAAVKTRKKPVARKKVAVKARKKPAATRAKSTVRRGRPGKKR